MELFMGMFGDYLEVIVVGVIMICLGIIFFGD